MQNIVKKGKAQRLDRIWMLKSNVLIYSNFKPEINQEMEAQSHATKLTTIDASLMESSVSSRGL